MTPAVAGGIVSPLSSTAINRIAIHPALLQDAKEARPMKKIVLETTAPFQGLPELVAYEEGLFAREGIEIEWADRDETALKSVV